MRKLLKYLKGYEKQCVLGPLFKMLEAVFELFIPLVVASIVDTGIGGGDRGYILKMCLVMIALGIIGLLMAVSAQYFSAVAAVGFSARLRHAVLKQILGLSYSQTDTLGTSTMITRMTSDINQVQNGVNLTLRLLLRSPFVVFGAMIMAPNTTKGDRSSSRRVKLTPFWTWFTSEVIRVTMVEVPRRSIWV